MPRVFRGLTWGEVAALVIAALMAVIVGFRLIVPPGLWFRVGSLDVHSATSCDQIVVEYNRKIVRPFYGTWRVEIEIAAGAGWEEAYSGPLHYQTYVPDAVLPDNGLVSLAWFTADDAICAHLGIPGEYRIAAYWVVNEGAFLDLLTRRVQRVALFEILEPS